MLTFTVYVNPTTNLKCRQEGTIFRSKNEALVRRR